MDRGIRLASTAAWTVAGDTIAGLLAGLAIFPAVFALGLDPSSGPGLLFATLPQVFAAMPLGRIVGVAFFLALGGAAYLSALAAFEVLVAGVTDNTRFSRKQATVFTAVLVMGVSIPPMLNMEIFIPWDLTFGTGFQTIGAMAAALTFGWALNRGAALKELAGGEDASGRIVFLYWWIRLAIPLAIGAVGTWWLITEVLS